MPEQNRVQALFPEGAAVVPNPEGTAPGVLLDVIRSGSQAVRVCCLPGVPAEMQQMWTETVVNQLAPGDEQRHCIRSKRIRCFGAGESAIEALLPDLIRRGRQPRVGITAAEATITLTVPAKAENELQCSAELEPTLAIIRESLGNLVYGENDDRLEDSVVRLLRARRHSLATIEWATQGLVIRSLDDAADGGAEIQAGLVVAHEAVLAAWLGSPVGLPSAASDNPAQLLRLVQQMAHACRSRFATDYALAVGPPTVATLYDDHIESLCVAVATPSGVRAEFLPAACHPAIAAAFHAKTAMNFLRLKLLTR